MTSFSQHIDGTAASSQKPPTLIERAAKLRALELEPFCDESFSAPAAKTEDYEAHAYKLRDFERRPSHSGKSKAALEEGALDKALAFKKLERHEEQALFRYYNFLQYLAHTGINSLEKSPTEKRVVEIEALLSEAARIKHIIVCCNHRLIISLAKKFVTPQRSIDDLFAEGWLAANRSVDKFDWRRGLKFSTYAYWAIQNRLIRFSDEEAKAPRILDDESGEIIARQEAPPSQTGVDCIPVIGRLFHKLDEREKNIITARFLLEEQKTLQEIADSLDISRERVRQIEARAIQKLQQMAGELTPDEADRLGLEDNWQDTMPQPKGLKNESAAKAKPRGRPRKNSELPLALRQILEEGGAGREMTRLLATEDKATLQELQQICSSHSGAEQATSPSEDFVASGVKEGWLEVTLPGPECQDSSSRSQKTRCNLNPAVMNLVLDWFCSPKAAQGEASI